MSAHALLIPELDEVIERGSPERRAKTLRRITTLFLDGAGQFNDDHLGLFDLVFNRLIVGAEVKLSVLGTGVVLTYGRDLRNGNNAFYGSVAQR